ncbi:family 8 glycosyl transferase [Syncephalis plumigaleata]|nr:family 8 glycosyl transferase [Syncephalis plumigaleata]
MTIDGSNSDEHATPKYAWATLLTRDSYLAGTRVLCRSLQNAATRYPLVVLYTDTLSESAVELLRQDNAVLKRIEPISNEDIPLPDVEQHLWSHYYDTWTKLRVWQLTEYERVCFLDSDMVVLRNMDEVFSASIGDEATAFEIAAAHACTCNPLKIKGYPATWTPENCAYTHQCAHCVGQSPPSPGPHTEYFNSGFMVLLPSDTEYQSIMRTASEVEDLSTLVFPDQDLLNLHFEGRIFNMPYIYNALKTLRNCHSAIWHDDDVKCIHYILEKPWSVDRNNPEVINGPFGELYAKWWEIYDQLRAEDIIKDAL